MEPTNVARIKRHFVKRSFGNSIFPAHWKKKKNSTERSQEKRGEKKPLPKQANSSPQQKKVNSN